MDYRGKFSDRLGKLTDAYVSKRNKDIARENEDIEQQNKRNYIEYKKKIQKGLKFERIPNIRKYTIKKMLDDIEESYGIEIPYQNFNLYTKNSSFPDLDVIKIFANLFQVSFEYMCGMTDIENEINSKVQEIIHLNSDAINTLIYFRECKEALCILNGLLADAKNSESLFINMYQQMYEFYVESKTNGNNADFQHMQEFLMKRMQYSEAVNRYIESNTLPFVQEDFDKQLESELNEQHFRNSQYDEYQKEMMNDINTYLDSLET